MTQSISFQGVDEMEHDSSRSGYHEPEPGIAGLHEPEEWGDDIVKTFSVNLIWAQASGNDGRPGAIGFKGAMPWHLAEDMRRFKELTVSHPVIMGRKTWESLDARFRPLPNRDNFVVSGDHSYRAPGATVVSDLETALDLARQEAIPDDGLDRSEIWVIGGAQIYQAMLPFANKAYITQIDAQVDADAYAPDMDALVQTGQWHVSEKSEWRTPKKVEGSVRRYRFLTLEKGEQGE
jgi:dihydrofolate reductase